MSFDLLYQEIQNGIDGKNSGIPMGFKRLNKYVGLRRRIYTVVFGSTGTGKTALTHNAYILQPFDYLSKNSSNIKMKVILFSMERSKVYTLAKWMSRKIFVEQGILIPIPKLLGWWEEKLTHDQSDLVKMYKDYINEVCEFCDIVEGPQNPTAVYKYLRDYARSHGKFEDIDEFNKVYIPDNETDLVVPIADHFGLTKKEKTMSKKEAIDKVSEHFQYYRDKCGYSPVGVSQVTRELGSMSRMKIDSFEPTIDHVKESGRPAEDADIVISLFQPSRYNTNDPSYIVENFIDPMSGGDYFRSLKILKNSYGEADLRIGMGFFGATGMFKELPKKNDMQQFDYQSLFNHSFFVG